MVFKSRKTVTPYLLAAACGLALTASAANAGPARYTDVAYQSGPEEVQVLAPHFKSASTRLNGPLEAVSLSASVHYDDLNLRRWRDARELKIRVRDAAQDVCTRLGEAYPVYQANGTSCYKTALENGIVRADAVIADARSSRYYRYND